MNFQRRKTKNKKLKSIGPKRRIAADNERNYAKHLFYKKKGSDKWIDDGLIPEGLLQSPLGLLNEEEAKAAVLEGMNSFGNGEVEWNIRDVPNPQNN
jgi:hypothetical protein